MKVINLTAGGFKKRVNDYDANPGEWKFLGDKPAIIDFYAQWCGPCKRLGPIMEELAEEYEGQVDIYKVDVDDEQELAIQFGVQSIPTLIFIPMQGAPIKSVGLVPKPKLKEIINSNLLRK